MQLVGQNDGLAEGSSKDSPQSVSEGDAPGSPSSPSSPSKSNAAAREKPVKVLPCPRCESMNTKFCYYNNYSVTQPRHFCRQCQRYWTAGGTLRNVPVGGGSRKKNRHPRAGEPYLQRPPMTTTNPAGPFGVPASGPQPGFQQMLSQEMMPLNFAQLPGGYQYAPYGLQESNHHHQHVYASMLTTNRTMPSQQQQDLPADLPPAMHAMYGTGPMANTFYEMPPPSDNNNAPAVVKPELWPMPPPKNGARFDLRLNNRPGWGGDQHGHHHHGDVKPKHGSPPHGSSTIEEEGSTPTNGYSNSGYEEGDTVSSMWHSLQHDETMFHDSMFHLNGDDHRC